MTLIEVLVVIVVLAVLLPALNPHDGRIRPSTTFAKSVSLINVGNIGFADGSGGEILKALKLKNRIIEF